MASQTASTDVRSGIGRTAWEAAVQQLGQQGFCIIPDVLDAGATSAALAALHAAAVKSRQQGNPTFLPQLDPNDRNVRVFYLLALDPIFRALIQHPLATRLAAALLGDAFIVSNFTANTALPGSGSMAIHSDQSLVVPEPWVSPWAMNVIWCLTDTCFENGATLYIPGSHRWTGRADVPEDAHEQLQPFEAPAGSIICMDARLWHTSGRNITKDQERALLFAYYSKPFLRPQVNWNALLGADLQAGFDDIMRERLGLNITANVGEGVKLSTKAQSGTAKGQAG